MQSQSVIITEKMLFLGMFHIKEPGASVCFVQIGRVGVERLYLLRLIQVGNQKRIRLSFIIKIRKITVVETDRRAGDPPFLVASSVKAEKVLGWKPVHALDDIIKSAWEWALILEKKSLK